MACNDDIVILAVHNLTNSTKSSTTSRYMIIKIEGFGVRGNADLALEAEKSLAKWPKEVRGLVTISTGHDHGKDNKGGQTPEITISESVGVSQKLADALRKKLKRMSGVDVRVEI
ncbi:MAG: hypothetical protein WCQ60_04145 [bacterium]